MHTPLGIICVYMFVTVSAFPLLQNARLREENRLRKIQEAKEHAERRQKKKMSKSAAAAKQAERDQATSVMAEDKAEDKKRRFEFLLNSASGDLFRKFVKVRYPLSSLMPSPLKSSRANHNNKARMPRNEDPACLVY